MPNGTITVGYPGFAATDAPFGSGKEDRIEALRLHHVVDAVRSREVDIAGAIRLIAHAVRLYIHLVGDVQLRLAEANRAAVGMRNVPFAKLGDFLPIELALGAKRDPSIMVQIRRLEETRIFEKNGRLVLQDFEGDGGLVLFSVENAEWFFFPEAEKGMAEVGLSPVECPATRGRFFEDVRSFLFRKLLNPMRRVFRHSGKCIRIHARFNRGVEGHAVDVIQQALRQSHRGFRLCRHAFYICFDA